MCVCEAEAQRCSAKGGGGCHALVGGGHDVQEAGVAGVACRYCMVVKAECTFQDGTGRCRALFDGGELVLGSLLAIKAHVKLELMGTHPKP